MSDEELIDDTPDRGYVTLGINTGEDNMIDFDIYRANWNPAEASYIYDAQLITFEQPNFALDAVLEDIISPSLKQEHFRFINAYNF